MRRASAAAMASAASAAAAGRGAQTARRAATTGGAAPSATARCASGGAWRVVAPSRAPWPTGSPGGRPGRRGGPSRARPTRRPRPTRCAGQTGGGGQTRWTYQTGLVVYATPVGKKGHGEADGDGHWPRATRCTFVRRLPQALGRRKGCGGRDQAARCRPPPLWHRVPDSGVSPTTGRLASHRRGVAAGRRPRSASGRLRAATRPSRRRVRCGEAERGGRLPGQQSGADGGGDDRPSPSRARWQPVGGARGRCAEDGASADCRGRRGCLGARRRSTCLGGVATHRRRLGRRGARDVRSRLPRTRPAVRSRGLSARALFAALAGVPPRVAT